MLKVSLRNLLINKLRLLLTVVAVTVVTVPATRLARGILAKFVGSPVDLAGSRST